MNSPGTLLGEVIPSSGLAPAGALQNAPVFTQCSGSSRALAWPVTQTQIQEAPAGDWRGGPSGQSQINCAVRVESHPARQITA